MAGIMAAVLGSPIAHSLSPRLHRAGYVALGIDSTSSYGSAEVTAAELAGFLDAHPRHTGFSLTMPLKTELVRIAGERDWEIEPTAAHTRAANTLIRTAHGPRIANTDVTGIVEAIAECLPAADAHRPHTAVILGSGATAASAVAAVARLGIAQVRILARRPERAQPLAQLASELGVHAALGPLRDYVPGAAALAISTLPAGALDPGALDWTTAPEPGALLLDVAYAPSARSLGAAFATHGGTHIGGERMLIHQAVEQQLAFAAAAGISAPAAHWRPRLASAMTAALITSEESRPDSTSPAEPNIDSTSPPQPELHATSPALPHSSRVEGDRR